MRPKGSAAALEARRMLAGKLLLEGRENDEVAEIVGVSLSSVKRLRWAVEKGGLEALRAKQHPGRTPRLDANQKQQLKAIGKSITQQKITRNYFNPSSHIANYHLTRIIENARAGVNNRRLGP